jgi:hypothetical protein
MRAKHPVNTTVNDYPLSEDLEGFYEIKEV